MTSTRTTARIRRRRAGAALVTVVAAGTALGVTSPASSSLAPVLPRAEAPAWPGTGDLRPALRDALSRAARDAADAGVEVVVESGRRTPEHQAQLLRDAIARYGSQDEAARWVARPERSAHVSGDAVDVRRPGATWLAEHGAAYGLCRVYDNEPWHFELRPDAPRDGCPATFADPTHDPRLAP